MISIIIPIYNARKHLHKLINCIKSQIFNDFEVLFVDNNSTDGSYEYLEQAVNEDNRFRLLKENRQGPNYARLRGFIESKGEYIYFCDADDLMNDKTLHLLYSTIVKYNSDIVVGDYCEINENGEITKHCKGINYEANENSNVYDVENIFFIKMPLWNKLFKKQIIHEEFFVFTKIGEDMLISLSSVANSKKISYINEEVYQYFVSEHGLSYNVTLENVTGIIDTCKGMNIIFERFFNKSFKYQIEYIQIQHILYRLLRSTLLTVDEQIKARKIVIPYLLSLDKNNMYFKTNMPFKMAYHLLVNEKCYALSKHILKFLFTNKTIHSLFKILDK